MSNTIRNNFNRGYAYKSSHNTVSESEKNKKRVALASVAGSAIGIAAAVTGIYTAQKKVNPSLLFNKLNYSEMDALAIGGASVLGGLTGGLIADSDKSNSKLKFREATQQFVGNMVFPLTFLALGNKLLDKANISLPKINSNSRPAQFVNSLISHLPSVVTTISCLVGGMEIGNKVMNGINNKIFNEKAKHDVNPEDYLVHTDDICLTANMLMKNSPKFTSFTSKILPISFIVSGAKTGMQQQDNN